MNYGYPVDDTIIRDVAIALERAQTKLALAGVFNDALHANMCDSDLQEFADALGETIDEVRAKRTEARARLAAAAHKLRIVKADEETR